MRVHAPWELISKKALVYPYLVDRTLKYVSKFLSLRACGPPGSYFFIFVLTRCGECDIIIYSDCRSFPMKQLIDDVGANRSRLTGYVLAPRELVSNVVFSLSLSRLLWNSNSHPRLHQPGSGSAEATTLVHMAILISLYYSDCKSFPLE